MTEKLCVFCDHFGWNEVSYYDYGGMTGGGVDGGEIKCAKGHGRDWPSLQWVDVSEFRKLILTANKCPDYSPPEPVAEGGGLPK